MNGAWNSKEGGTRKELERSANELREKVRREAEVWRGVEQRHPDGLVWMMIVIGAVLAHLLVSA